jgi:hypothetical protein
MVMMTYKTFDLTGWLTMSNLQAGIPYSQKVQARVIY